AQGQRHDHEGKGGEEQDAAHPPPGAVRVQQFGRIGHDASPRRGIRAVATILPTPAPSSTASSPAITSATTQLNSATASVVPAVVNAVVGMGGSSSATPAERCWYSTPSCSAIRMRLSGSMVETARCP